jgi:hypothetical protein
MLENWDGRIVPVEYGFSHHSIQPCLYLFVKEEKIKAIPIILFTI